MASTPLTPERVQEHLGTEADVASITRVEVKAQGYDDVSEFHRLRELQRLDVPDNAIQSLKSFRKNKKLRHLSLANNQLQSLEGVEKLKSLRVLNVSGNRIQSIEGVEGLSGLAALICNDNALDSVQPLQRAEMPNLNTLVLSGNEIESLKGCLDNLPALSKLSASRNRLRSLKKCFSSTTRLKELRIANNLLTSLPDDLPQTLTLVDLSSNPVRTYEAISPLGRLSNLRQVSLKNTPLASEEGYSERMLTWLPHLKILDNARVDSEQAQGVERRKKAEERGSKRDGDGASQQGKKRKASKAKRLQSRDAKALRAEATPLIDEMEEEAKQKQDQSKGYGKEGARNDSTTPPSKHHSQERKKANTEFHEEVFGSSTANDPSRQRSKNLIINTSDSLPSRHQKGADDAQSCKKPRRRSSSRQCEGVKAGRDAIEDATAHWQSAIDAIGTGVQSAWEE